MLVDRVGLIDRWWDESRGVKSLNKNSVLWERYYYICRFCVELGLNLLGGKFFELDGSGLVGYKVEIWIKLWCYLLLWNVFVFGLISWIFRGI